MGWEGVGELPDLCDQEKVVVPRLNPPKTPNVPDPSNELDDNVEAKHKQIEGCKHR